MELPVPARSRSRSTAPRTSSDRPASSGPAPTGGDGPGAGRGVRTGAGAGLGLPPATDRVWADVPLELRQRLAGPAHQLVTPARGGLAEKGSRPLRLALTAAARMRATGAHWRVLLNAPRAAFGGPTSERAQRAYEALQAVVAEYLEAALADRVKAPATPAAGRGRARQETAPVLPSGVDAQATAVPDSVPLPEPGGATTVASGDDNVTTLPPVVADPAPAATPATSGALGDERSSAAARHAAAAIEDRPASRADTKAAAGSVAVPPAAAPGQPRGGAGGVLVPTTTHEARAALPAQHP